MIREYKHNPRTVTPEAIKRLEEHLKELGDLSGITHDLNSDEIITGNQRSTVFDINNCEIVITHKSTKPNKQGTVAVGYVVWGGHKYNYRQVKWNDEQRKKACIVANTFAGIFKFEGFDVFSADELTTFGVSKKYILKTKISAEASKKEPMQSDIKVIKLFFDKNVEPKFRDQLNYIRKNIGAANITDTIFTIAKMAYSDHI